jgi:hypothetical protein
VSAELRHSLQSSHAVACGPAARPAPGAAASGGAAARASAPCSRIGETALARGGRRDHATATATQLSIARPGRRGAGAHSRALGAPRAALGIALLLAAVWLRRAVAWLYRALPAIAAGLAAAIPVLRSTVHAVAIGWQPAGDDGIILTRAWDVFTAHSPLIGQYSEAGIVTGQVVHSPGPLLYWLLALPVRFASTASVAGWMGAVNTLAIIGAVALARRRGGFVLMFATAAAIALMCQSLPSESFHDVWNPAAALFPFLLLIFVCWSLACGELRLLPLAVLLASFVTQTHLTYLTPTLGMFAVLAACLLAARRARPPRSRRGELAAAAEPPPGERAPAVLAETPHAGPPASEAAPAPADPSPRNGRSRPLRRPARRGSRRVPETRRWVLAALLVAAVCWAAPVIDEIEHSPGNLSLIVQTTEDRGTTLGAGIGWNAVVRAVGVPPWWLYVPASEWSRKSDVRHSPGGGAVAAALTLLAALGLVAIAGIVRRRRAIAAAALIGFVLCAALDANVAQTPVLPLLAATIGYTAWWGSILGMWVWLVLAWATWLLCARVALHAKPLRGVRKRLRAAPQRGRRLAGVLAWLACLGAVAGVGTAVAASERADSHVHQYRPIAAIVARLDEVIPSHATVRLSLVSQTVSTQPIEPAVRFGLVRHGDRVLSVGAFVRLGDYYELLDKRYRWYVVIGDGRRRRKNMARVITVSFSDGFGHSTFSAWIARVGPGGRLEPPAGLGPPPSLSVGRRVA